MIIQRHRSEMEENPTEAKELRNMSRLTARYAANTSYNCYVVI